MNKNSGREEEQEIFELDEQALQVIENGEGDEAKNKISIFKSIKNVLGQSGQKENQQKKRFMNLLGFLALILALTLLARGTAGASLAVVKVGSAVQADLLQQIEGSGTVLSEGVIDIEAPEGLTVKRVAVSVGEKVEAGGKLVLFDDKEVADATTLISADLAELRLKLQKLSRTVAGDNSMVEAARKALERAQADYNETKARGEERIAAVETAYSAAVSNRDKAKAELKVIEDSGVGDKVAAQQKLAEAEQALRDAEAGLPAARQAAKQEAADALKAADRAVQQAQQDYEAAKRNAEKDAQSNADENAQNQIEIKRIKLEIEKKEKVQTQLSAITKNENWMTATESGIVQQVPKTGTKTSAEPFMQISDADGGYIIHVDVKRKEVENLALGGNATITSGGSSYMYSEEKKGKVVAISEADADDMVKVSIRLDGMDWKQGDSVQVRIVKSEKNYNMCIPIEALRSGSGGYYVLVVETRKGILGTENVLRHVPVTVEAKNSSMAAINGPIGFGEQIVVSSTKAVQDGSKVRVSE